MTATGVMFVLLLAGGVFGWRAVDAPLEGQSVQFPGWIILPALAAFALVLVGTFKPTTARIVGPIYAVLEGIFLGAISHAYELRYEGLVVQAIGATAAVFAAMWFLYATRIIKVTDKFRRVIVGATMGIALFYGVALIMRLFGAEAPFINSPSGLGIGFSVLVVGVAAFNLMLDFDMIEKGTEAGLPKHMEWFCAMGLMVTIVWLYLEILRLLAKLQSRD